MRVQFKVVNTKRIKSNIVSSICRFHMLAECQNGEQVYECKLANDRQPRSVVDQISEHGDAEGRNADDAVAYREQAPQKVC